MLLSYRFCVDDPYCDDQEDRVDISRIFHSVLVENYDYHTMETSQDNSVITTETTENYQVSKQQLIKNGSKEDMGDETALVEETVLIDQTHSNIKTGKADNKETEASEIKHTKTQNISKFKRGKYEEETCLSKTVLKVYIKVLNIHAVQKGIIYLCPNCAYQATKKK